MIVLKMEYYTLNVHMYKVLIVIVLILDHIVHLMYIVSCGIVLVNGA